MKTQLSLLAGVIGLGLVACADPPAPKAPAAAPVETKTRTTGAPVGPSAPAGEPTRSSQVSVSDEIMRLCGIQAATSSSQKFAFDSADLQDDDRALLQQVAKCFTTGPLKGRSMSLTGRADTRGETEYNMNLGAARSANVKNYLASLGIQPARMDATSRGELDATGTDDEGYARDRRVDITLVAQK